MYRVKIKDADDHEVEVEVSDEVYKVFQDYDRKVENQSHERRRHWDKRCLEGYISDDNIVSSELTEDQVCLFETLNSILNNCTPNQRTRFYLYLSGYSLSEIAQIQHCHRADGTYVKRVRLRYQCHYKIRHPQLCEAQSGYGVIKLDGIVEKYIHHLFDQIKTIPENEMIKHQMKEKEVDFKTRLSHSKTLRSQREKELTDYQSEVLKIIRDESQLNMPIINGLIEKTQEEITAVDKEVEHWQSEIEHIEQKAVELHNLFGKVVSWSEMYDTCNMSEKKMIVSQLIKQVRVKSDYSIEIDFTFNIEQLLNYQATTSCKTA